MLSHFSFEELLPSYLLDTEKGRIRNALSQFFDRAKPDIDYDGFYVKSQTPYLMQADVLHSVMAIDFDITRNIFITGYTPTVLISNTCDVSELNERTINQKEALFAPIIPLGQYVDDCQQQGFKSDQIKSFCSQLKRQEFSNLFYLPPIGSEDYIVRLDKTYWLPQSQLLETSENLHEARYVSLSNWAYYLFIAKLSLHFCRVPEEVERPESN